MGNGLHVVFITILVPECKLKGAGLKKGSKITEIRSGLAQINWTEKFTNWLTVSYLQIYDG